VQCSSASFQTEVEARPAFPSTKGETEAYSMNIADLFTDATDFMNADVPRLGAALVRVAQTNHGDQRFQIGDFRSQITIAYGTVHQGSLDALGQALNWAKHAYLVVEDHSQTQTHVFFRLTPLGKSFKPADIDVIKLRNILPDYLLHPTVRSACLSIFMAGHFEAAVFEAFKQVEAATREAAGFPLNEHGLPMMTKAFHADNGPLRHDSEVWNERQGLQNMMSGMIGLLKNPRSHRNTDLTDPIEAAEMMVIASFAMRRIEVARKRNEDAQN
jgi:uncharacterized protein (TIGR02391 family)